MSDRSKKPLLVDFAEHVALWFEELNGRSIAVSEVEPFKDKTNVPTLPMAVSALVSETNLTSGSGGSTSVNLSDDVMCMFIFEPTKYKDKNKRDLPFFAFYDYEALRDRFLEEFREYRGPRNQSAAFRTLEVESDEFAVYVSLRIQFTGTSCYGASEPVASQITFGVKPASGVCKAQDELPDGCDLSIKE